jgi:hypothetical protein
MGACDRASRKPRPVSVFAYEPYTDTEGRPSLSGYGAVRGHTRGCGHTNHCKVMQALNVLPPADPVNGPSDGQVAPHAFDYRLRVGGVLPFAERVDSVAAWAGEGSFRRVGGVILAWSWSGPRAR